MRQDNLEQHIQGYGDFFRGVALDNPPKGLENWALQDWRDGHNAASTGIAVAQKAIASKEESEAEVAKLETILSEAVKRAPTADPQAEPDITFSTPEGVTSIRSLMATTAAAPRSVEKTPEKAPFNLFKFSTWGL